MNVAATVADPTPATSDKSSAEQPAIGRSGLLFLVGAVLVLGLLPRLQQLGAISVWFDEAFSRKMTTFGFVEIWDRTARDVHPPLYYWLLKVWTLSFGDSPVALRSMSVLFGLLTILGTFLLVREAGRGWKQRSPGIASQADAAALLAAAFVALSPFQIAWSLQARMYSLGTALAVLSSWLLLRALRPGPPRLADWVGYVLLAVALSYTHIFGIFTIAAQAMFALAAALRRGWSISGTGRWQTLGAVLLTFFAIELCWLPWAGEFLAQRDRVAAGYWIPPFRWERVLEVAYQFFAVSEHDAPVSPVLAWTAAGFCGLLTVGLLLFGRSGLDATSRPWEKLLTPYLIAAFDDDGDGLLNLYEFRLTPPANPYADWYSPRMDANYDGRLSWEEYYHEESPQFIGLYAEYYRRFDRDRDELLAPQELEFRVDLAKVSPEVAFTVQDKDGDDRITFDEVFTEPKPEDGDARKLQEYQLRLIRAEESFLTGDADGDGAINAAEFRTARRHAAATAVLGPAGTAGTAATNEEDGPNWLMIGFLTLDALVLVGIGFWVFRGSRGRA